MPDLLFEKRDGVALVTLNRPAKKNALTPEMFVRLAEAWTEFRTDDGLRVAILTGAGDTFSAGADLGRLIPLLTRARAADDDWDRRLLADPTLFQAAILRRFELWKPVIAAVNGAALAGGCEMLQATDLRLAAPEASFGLPEPKRGIVPGGGSLVRLARQIPYVRAMQILLTGDALPAATAFEIGFVNEIVPREKLLERAFELAARIAENGPLAVRKIKEAVIRSQGRPLEEAFAIEEECSREVMRSADAREGPRAFMEKRRPNFTGR
ncbi:MAG: enoyl-CoA hydratase/isomerase family protein [Deltaproteobacteria bacterium]|nr:enoyl-CoA hydratase/isomerase family protein [Deltaproteobacteria bacterium]